MNEPGRREVDPRWVFLIGALLLAALSFASVDFIPGTDLPQHAAQVRLLREVWGLAPATTDLSNLTARPLGANTLCYWPLLAFSAFASPPLAVKLCVFFWVTAAICAWHWLAWRRERSPAVALVTSTLLFGLPLYWGLLNFLSGVAVFFVFCERALDPRPRSRRDVGVDVVLVLLLYLAHVLWVAVAAALTIARFVANRRGWSDAWSDALSRIAVFVPVAVLGASWLAQLIQHRSARGFPLEPQYLTAISERLSPSWLASSLFGGIRGPFEPLVVACIAGYALMSALHARRSSAKSDRALVALGLAGLVFVLVAPDQYLNTMLFNDRYLGYSAMFLLLGLPHPGGRALTVLSALLACVFSLGTTTAWILYDAELSGLRPSLAAIDRPSRVLGLDYRKHSDVLRDRPFMQLFAYAQAEHGGELSFSFAAHQSSIISYRKPPPAPWTPGLEWNPEKATDRDLAAFDCVLVHATDEQHAAFAVRFGTSSLAPAGRFRTYCHAPDHGRK